MIGVEIEWAAVRMLDGLPALSVMSRYFNGAATDRVHHVIPLADLERFNPPLSVWQLIEVACAPAAEAQERRDRATAAAIAKRARRLARNQRSSLVVECMACGAVHGMEPNSCRPSWRNEADARLAAMAGALH